MKSVVGRMFDGIAPTYTLLNHILSFGLDFSWRRKLADRLEKGRPIEVLDLATGTGDLLISMLRRRDNIKKAVGLDISEVCPTVLLLFRAMPLGPACPMAGLMR